MYMLNEQEYLKTQELAPKERFSYTIKRIVDWQKLWTIGSENGFVMLSDEQGREMLPVWPHRRFVESFCVDEWEDYEPIQLKLDEFVDKWIPGMLKDKRLASIFPVLDPFGTMAGYPVSVSRLLEALEVENEL